MYDLVVSLWQQIDKKNWLIKNLIFKVQLLITILILRGTCYISKLPIIIKPCLNIFKINEQGSTWLRE